MNPYESPRTVSQPREGLTIDERRGIFIAICSLVSFASFVCAVKFQAEYLLLYAGVFLSYTIMGVMSLGHKKAGSRR